jgi:hypothetical protein
MWASQLLTIRVMSTSTTISFNTDGQYLGRVELVMFNCLQWRIEVQTRDATTDATTPPSLNTITLPPPDTTTATKSTSTNNGTYHVSIIHLFSIFPLAMALIK